MKSGIRLTFSFDRYFQKIHRVNSGNIEGRSALLQKQINAFSDRKGDWPALYENPLGGLII